MKKLRSSQATILVLNWIKHSFSLWVSLKLFAFLNMFFYVHVFISSFQKMLFNNLIDCCWNSLTVEQILLRLRTWLKGIFFFNESWCSDFLCKKLWQKVVWRCLFLPMYTYTCVFKNEIAFFEMLKSNFMVGCFFSREYIYIYLHSNAAIKFFA